MVRAGFPKQFGAGVITTSGALGILIPPSIVMVMYSVATNTSVGALFMAGVIPGIGLLNVNGFYDPLLAMFDKAVNEGFLRAQNRAMALAATDIEALLATMAAYQPEPVSKWLKEEKQL